MYIRLVPLDRQLLSSRADMGAADLADMWMERNSCYSLLVRELVFSVVAGNGGGGNFPRLARFESGDAETDVEAWDRAVEFVVSAGAGWSVERRGVFVRDAEAAGEDMGEAGVE